MFVAAELTICWNFMKPYFRVDLWYNFPKESTGPLWYLQVQHRIRSCSFTSTFYSADGSISIAVYVNLTNLGSGPIFSLSNTNKVTFSKDLTSPCLLMQPTPLLLILFSAISCSKYIEIDGSFHRSTLGLCPCSYELSLCTNISPSFLYGVAASYTYRKLSTLQGKYCVKQIWNCVLSANNFMLRLDIVQACLKSNQLPVIGFDFHTIRSDIIIVFAYQLKYTSRIVPLYALWGQGSSAIVDPLLSQIQTESYFIISRHLLPSPRTATKNQERFWGTETIQSLTCISLRQYLLVLQSTPLLFFFFCGLLLGLHSSCIFSYFQP